MSNRITTNTKAKYIALEAVITRANGEIEQLGIIAESHFTFFGKFKATLKKIFRNKKGINK